MGGIAFLLILFSLIGLHTIWWSSSQWKIEKSGHRYAVRRRLGPWPIKNWSWTASAWFSSYETAQRYVDSGEADRRHDALYG